MPQLQIKDVIAFICDIWGLSRHPSRNLSVAKAQRVKSVFDQLMACLPAKFQHFDRQGKRSKRINAFAGISDDNHFITGHSNNFFLQQRTPAALDQVEIGIKLICAINCQIKLRQLFKCQHFNADFTRQLRRAARRWHTFDIQPLVTHPVTKTTHQKGRCAACAKTDPHTGFNQLRGPLGGREFSAVIR